MRWSLILTTATLFALACSAREKPPAPDTATTTVTPATQTSPTGGRDTRVNADASTDAAASDVRVEGSCEAVFWRTTVVRNNAGLAGAPALADRSFRYIRDHVEALNARGAHITVGGVLALLVFEGGGRVAFYNDRCKENSYVRAPGCWSTPKARYSYQYGLGAIHTSLFHPCKAGPAMRRQMNKSLRAHGFAPTATDIDSIAPALRSICAKAVPDAVDYYILAAHDRFGIPHDSADNLLTAVGRFPFFSPELSIDLFFAEVGSDPTRLSSDRAMIVVYGGKDARYSKQAYQSSVLGTYTNYRDAKCQSAQ